MSHPPPTPEPHIPSALTQLFAEGNHFLRPNEGDILMDPTLGEDEPEPETVAAIAAAANASASVNEGILDGSDVAVQQHEADTPHGTEHGAGGGEVSASPAEHAQSATPEPERAKSASAIEVFATSLRAENDRIRRAIAALEGEQTVVEELGGDSLITQHTLRELASAAAGEPSLAGFGFEGLQGLDGSFPESQPAAGPSTAPAGPSASTNTATLSDFLHGLMSEITTPPRGYGPERPRKRADPFAMARAALEEEIASTRAAIAAKEAEIAAAKDGNATPSSAESLPSRAEIDAQLAKTDKALESARSRAAVLRDVIVRMTEQRDAVLRDLREKEAELATYSPPEGAQVLTHRALLDVRGYIEGVLKTYKEQGKLPAPPLPSLPPLAQTNSAPPSSLPKKRGRPPRTAQKASVVPAQLAHLVPDTAEVAARAEHTPIRRKGIKRNKVELEREQQRISEETEMMKSLARMGVWKNADGEWQEAV